MSEQKCMTNCIIVNWRCLKSVDNHIYIYRNHGNLLSAKILHWACRNDGMRQFFASFALPLRLCG